MGYGVSASEDEEEEKSSGTTGRPNAYWQARRLAEKGEPDTFSGSFRGVPTPHAGQQTVKPEDTKGAGHLCWCGEPYNHDWPGKAAGTKHPKGTSVTTMTEAPPRIDRRQLRAYHRDLQEVILAAVNQYGCRFKMNNSHTVLYAHDGEHTYKVPARNNEQAVNRTRDWFAKYVVGLDVETGKIANPMVKDGKVLIDDLEAREKRDRQEEARKAEERRQAAIEQTLRDEEERKLLADQEAILRLAKAKNSEEHPVPKPPKPAVESPVETWTTYVSSRTGIPNEQFETDGTAVRCKECIGTDHYILEGGARGVGGHTRMWHRDRTTMYDEDAMARKVDSGKATRLSRKVAGAIDLLIEATGYQGDSARIAELEAENERLRSRCADVEAANKRADDAEARLALIQEAIRA